MTTREVAETLSVTMGRVRQLVMTGDIVPAEKVGQSWLFSTDEVKRYQSHRKPTTTPTTDEPTTPTQPESKATQTPKRCDHERLLRAGIAYCKECGATVTN